MFSRQTPRPPGGGRPVTVPSRGALQALRNLALRGNASTAVGTVGGLCTVALVSYDIHCKTQVAQRIVEQKKEFQKACPNYRVNSSGRRGFSSAATVGDSEQSPPDDDQFDLSRNTRRRDKPAEESREEHMQAPFEQPTQELNTATQGKEELSVPSPPKARGSQTPFPQIPSVQPSTREIAEEVTISSIARNRLAHFCLRYANDNDTIPLNTRIHRLLQQGKIVEATQNFLDLYVGSSDFSRQSRRDAAVTLFYANLKDDNVGLAGAVFQAIEDYFEVTPALWELMILALGKIVDAEGIAELYQAYQDSFVLPVNLSVLTLRALLDTYRIEEAKDFTQKYLYRDTDCAITGLYLQGVWGVSGKVDMVEAQFSKFLQKLAYAHAPINEKLFEPLLQAYIEHGYEEKAWHLIRLMNNEYGVPCGLRTLGLIAYSKALKCDWEAVEADLLTISKSGTADLHPHKLRKIFHRIFLEYTVANSGKKILEFIVKAVEEYGIVPDQLLFERMIRSLIERGTPEMIDEVLAMSQRKGWQVEIDRDKFVHDVRTARFESERGASGLWAMYRAIRQKKGYAALSNRVLGYDITKIPMEQAYKLPWNHQPTQWWKNAMQLREPKKPLNQFIPLHSQMLHFIQAGKSTHALLLYRAAKAAGFVVKRLHVELAITASIIHEEGIRFAQDLLEEDQAIQRYGFGSATAAPFFFQQLVYMDPHEITVSEALKFAVLGFYALLERKLFPFKHNLVASVSSRLIVKGRADVALELLRTVCKSRYGAMVPFDDSAIKVLVRGFADAGNLKGLRWAIFTALKRPELLTRTLITDVLRVLETLRLRKPASESGVKVEAYEAYLEHLAKLADLLCAKYKAILPKYERTALDKAVNAVDAFSVDEPEKDPVAKLIESNKLRISRIRTEHPLSPPLTPTEEEGWSGSEDGDAKYAIERPVLDSDDVQDDFQYFENILANWRERVELDRCLGGDGDESIEVTQAKEAAGDNKAAETRDERLRKWEESTLLIDELDLERRERLAGEREGKRERRQQVAF